MPFTAKVKSTGQLFLVAGETGKDGILHDAFPPVRPHVAYSGNLFDAYPGNSPWVEYSSSEWAVLDGDELEDFPVEMRLVPVR